MFVIGGYLLTYDQLYQLGFRRGLIIEGGKSHILNNDLAMKGIESIYAWPVCHPRGPVEVPRTLICTRRGDQYLERLADCQPFVENEDDLKVKKWLENHGLKDIPFVAVPDPHMRYNEDGTVSD
jgi:hypothetical protein